MLNIGLLLTRILSFSVFNINEPRSLSTSPNDWKLANDRLRSLKGIFLRRDCGCTGQFAGNTSLYARGSQ